MIATPWSPRLLFALLLWSSATAQIALPGVVSPIDTLYLRGNCSDLVPPQLNFGNLQVIEIPANDLRGRYTNEPPPFPELIVTLTARFLTASYFTPEGQLSGASEIHLFADALDVGQHALGMQISYDFNGDGIWDRVEVAKDQPLNNNIGFQPVDKVLFGEGVADVLVAGEFTTLLSGIVELKLWSAFNSTEPIYVQTDGSSFIRIPYYASVGTYPVPSNDACVIPSTAGPTNRVAFKLESVEDYFLTLVNRAIMDVFKNRGIPLTVGVAGDSFGNDNAITAYLASAVVNPDWKVEVGCNGYSLVFEPNVTFAAQVAEMTACRQVISTKLGVEPDTFMPKYSTSNFYTVQAARAAGYTHYSTVAGADFGPYEFTNSPFYRFPAGAFTNSDTNYQLGLTAVEIFAQIQDQLLNTGYSVVQMTPFPFAANLGFEDIVNTDMIAQLEQLLDLVTAENYEVVTVNNLNADAIFNKTVQKVSCDCVAFRLDDLQDYYGNTLKAVMDVFLEFQAPITVGVVSSLWGDDTVNMENLAAFMLNASLSQCFDVEIASGGYSTNPYTNYTALEQVQFLNAANDQIELTTQVRPTVFLPPGDLWNLDLINALITTGFTHMSSTEFVDGGVHNYEEPVDLYRFPTGAQTGDYDEVAGRYIGASHLSVFEDVEIQQALRGWSAVKMNILQFSQVDDITGSPIDVANETMIAELRSLLSLVRANGLRIVPLGAIQDYFGNTDVDPCAIYGPATSSVASSTQSSVLSSTEDTEVPSTTDGQQPSSSTSTPSTGQSSTQSSATQTSSTSTSVDDSDLSSSSMIKASAASFLLALLTCI